MKKQIVLLVISGCVALITGCASVAPLKPGAEKIVITSNTMPSSCRYVGQVFAEDINGSTQMYTSHQHLQADQINLMKNQALKLGANVIMLTGHKTTYVNKVSGTRVDTHNMSGNAYVCSAVVLKNITEGNVSDLKANE